MGVSIHILDYFFHLNSPLVSKWQIYEKKIAYECRHVCLHVCIRIYAISEFGHLDKRRKYEKNSFLALEAEGDFVDQF